MSNNFNSAKNLKFNENKTSIVFDQCVLTWYLYVSGILVAQVLSLNEILGTPDLWPVLLAFTVVPTIFQLIVLPFLPESPRCLLIDKNEEEKATKGDCLNRNLID